MYTTYMCFYTVYVLTTAKPDMNTSSAFAFWLNCIVRIKLAAKYSEKTYSLVLNNSVYRHSQHSPQNTLKRVKGRKEKLLQWHSGKMPT